MNNQKGINKIVLIVIFAILIAGVVFSSIAFYLEEKRTREEFIIQAQILEKAVNVKRVLSLSGSEADLNSPDYQRLKEQLASVCSINSKYRFIYLMGQRPDGEVFFFVDSEPQDSKDYSPPGQVYTETSPALLNVFSKGKEVVEGPASDRWGKWVSALVPITNPETGKIIAILGMDIDARNWMGVIIYHSLAPLVITLLVSIVLGTFLFFQYRGEQEKIQLAISKMALQRSEESFQQLFENLTDGVAIFKASEEEGNFVFVNLNKKGEEISRINRKDIIGKRVTEVFPATAEIGLLDVLRRVWRTGASEYLPGILYKDKRIEHWTENYVLRLPSGLVVSIYSNITKRKQAEEEIKSLAKFTTEDPSPVLRIDRDGKLLFVNQAGLKKLVNWHLQIGKIVFPVLRDLVFKALESGLEQQCELEHSDHVYSFYVAPIIESGYANLYGRDITELKQAEQKLKKDLHELEVFYKASVGREERILELKMQIKELEQKLGKVK
ncbi:MAG: PAS domain-containing protein [Candidatus Omnitrophica bacterium]|nr:PAS domain-containing protein [Candidatus Omnitrophota bacterium]